MPSRILIILCVLLLAAGRAASQENLRPKQPVAFVGGMLLDGYEAEPIHHSVVVIDAGRIVAVGPKSSTWTSW